MSLNLSSQPFVNSRPVRRLVLVLWCLSALLIAADLFLYARHFSGQQARRGRLEELIAQETRERERLTELEQQLAGFDLAWQRRQIDFLNLRIAERVFPWSRLFDRVAEALPPQVRLTKLRPEIERPSDAATEPEEIVRLEIQAEAGNEESMLDFVNRLFEHPAFSNPNLASESRRDQSGITDFALTVAYLPATGEPPPPAAPAAASEGAP